MFAVTYTAEEINLLPSIPNSLTQFYGEVELDALPDGRWTVDEISALVTDYTVRPITSAHVKIERTDPIYPLIVAALEAHDKATGAIGRHVREQLGDAYRSSRFDHDRSMRLQAAERAA